MNTCILYGYTLTLLGENNFTFTRFGWGSADLFSSVTVLFGRIVRSVVFLGVNNKGFLHFCGVGNGKLCASRSLGV